MIDRRITIVLSGVSDDIRDWIARTGLCEPRQPANAAPTLEHWAAKYSESRHHELKLASLKRIGDTAAHLIEYFGKDITIDAISIDSAKD